MPRKVHGDAQGMIPNHRHYLSPVGGRTHKAVQEDYRGRPAVARDLVVQISAHHAFATRSATSWSSLRCSITFSPRSVSISIRVEELRAHAEPYASTKSSIVPGCS